MHEFLSNYWLLLIIGILVFMFFGKSSSKRAIKSNIKVQDYIPNGPIDRNAAKTSIKKFASDLGSGSKGEKHYLEILDKICSGELAVIQSERINAEHEAQSIEEHKQNQLRELLSEKRRYDLSEKEYKEGVKEIERIAKEEMKSINRLFAWCDKQEYELNSNISKPLKFVLTAAKKNWNEGGWDTYFHFTEDDYPSIQEKIPN